MTDTESTAGLPQWRPVVRARSHELVVSAVEDQIMSGVLGVGDALPPERELAARLQVSRASVREAIRVLESQGVVVSSVGAGAGAGTFIASMPSEALTRFLRLHVALANFPMADIVEARVMLERNSAKLAAARVDDTALAAIRAPLAVMDTVTIDCESFNDADTDFHVAIAESSGNRLVADMTIAIRASLRQPILAAMEALTDWSALARTLQQQHHGLFAAIERHDGDAAADLAEAHIRYSYQALPALGSRTPR